MTVRREIAESRCESGARSPEDPRGVLVQYGRGSEEASPPYAKARRSERERRLQQKFS